MTRIPPSSVGRNARRISHGKCERKMQLRKMLQPWRIRGTCERSMQSYIVRLKRLILRAVDQPLITVNLTRSWTNGTPSVRAHLQKKKRSKNTSRQKHILTKMPSGVKQISERGSAGEAQGAPKRCDCLHAAYVGRSPALRKMGEKLLRLRKRS